MRCSRSCTSRVAAWGEPGSSSQSSQAIRDTGLRQARKSGVPRRSRPPVSGVANRRSQPPQVFPTCPGKSLSSAHTGTAMKLGHLGHLFSTPTRTRKKRCFQKPLFFVYTKGLGKRCPKCPNFRPVRFNAKSRFPGERRRCCGFITVTNADGNPGSRSVPVSGRTSGGATRAFRPRVPHPSNLEWEVTVAARGWGSLVVVVPVVWTSRTTDTIPRQPSRIW